MERHGAVHCAVSPSGLPMGPSASAEGIPHSMLVFSSGGGGRGKLVKVTPCPHDLSSERFQEDSD